MKNAIISVFVLILSLFSNSMLFVPQSTYAARVPVWRSEARVRFFYEGLRPYGEWFWHRNYGWCWYPYNVSANWRPYSDGYWVYTDYGWEWVSEASWGWACFHYGRWFYDNTNGWCWYPDTVWAPSWCCFRYGEDWVGWAALPPEALWDEERGLVFSDFDADDFIPRHAFCFVKRRDFADRDLRHRIMDPARNVTIMKETNIDVKNIRMENRRIENRLSIQKELEHSFGHPVKELKLTTVNSPSGRGIGNNELRIYRPDIAEFTRESKVTGNVSEKLQPGANRGKESESRIQETAPVSKRSAGQGVINATEEGGVNLFKQPEAPKSNEMIQRHESEMRALEQSQESRRQALEAEHAREIQVSPQAKHEQLFQQHREEMNSFHEQSTRERQMLQSFHSQEQRMMTAPGAVSRQHFDFSQPRSVSRSQGSSGFSGHAEGSSHGEGGRGGRR